MSDLRLILYSGETVDIMLHDYAYSAPGCSSFGSFETVVERAARKGFISFNESGQICGESGGCGPVVIPWHNIRRIKKIERKKT